jgi:hypothetical protein
MPTIPAPTLHALLALAADQDLEVKQLDVITAPLNM